MSERSLHRCIHRLAGRSFQSPSVGVCDTRASRRTTSTRSSTVVSRYSGPAHPWDTSLGLLGYSSTLHLCRRIRSFSYHCTWSHGLPQAVSPATLGAHTADRRLSVVRALCIFPGIVGVPIQYTGASHSLRPSRTFSAPGTRKLFPDGRNILPAIPEN